MAKRRTRVAVSVLALLVPERSLVAKSERGHDLAEYDQLRWNPSAVAPSPDVTLVVQDETELSLRHLQVMLPFSTRGSLGPRWIHRSLGALLAVSHFNGGVDTVVPQIRAATGRCPDLKFTLELADTRYGPIDASRHMISSVLPRAKDAPPDPARPFPTALIGASSSSVSMPLHTLAAVHGLVQLSPTSTSTALDNKGEYPLFGRTIPSVRGDAAAIIDYMADVLGVTHFGVLHQQGSYGSSFARELRGAAGRRDPPVRTVTASFPFRSTHGGGDGRGPLVRAVSFLRRSRYRYFFGLWSIKAHDVTMGELRRQGISGDGYFWIFGDVLESLQSDYSVPAGGGGNSTDDPHPVVVGTTGSALLTMANPALLAEDGVSNPCVEAWGDAARNDETRRYLRSNLPDHIAEGEAFWENLRLSNSPSASGSTLYDAAMAIQLAACDLHSVKGAGGGKPSEVPVTFTGPELYEAYLNTTFNGCSGQVITDPDTGTRDHKSVPYTVTNIVARAPDKDTGVVTFSAAPTGLYQEGRWHGIGKNEFVYSDGTTAPPDVLPPPDAPHNYNFIDPIAQGFGWAFCGVIMLLSTGWAAWTHKLRASPVVKASQPIFLYMLCLGTLLMGSAIVPLSLQESNVSDPDGLDKACMAVPWLLSMGFTLAFSALEAKLRRVNMIFGKADKFRRVKVLPKDVMKPLISLLSVNLVILIAWTVVAPLRWHRTYFPNSIDMFGRPTGSYGTCKPPKYEGADITFLVLWVIIPFTALVYANFSAYRGDFVSTEYSEAKYIKVSMAFLLQAVVIGAPSIVVSKNRPTAWFLVTTLIIVVVCLSILVPVFVPKIIYYREWKAREAEKAEKKKMRLKRMEEMAVKAKGDEAGGQRNTPADLGTTNKTETELSAHGPQAREEEPLKYGTMRAKLSNMRKENLLLEQQRSGLRQSISHLSGRNVHDGVVADGYPASSVLSPDAPSGFSGTPARHHDVSLIQEEKVEETIDSHPSFCMMTRHPQA